MAHQIFGDFTGMTSEGRHNTGNIRSIKPTMVFFHIFGSLYTLGMFFWQHDLHFGRYFFSCASASFTPVATYKIKAIQQKMGMVNWFTTVLFDDEICLQDHWVKLCIY
jgi:hypothetical protein